MRPRPFLLAPLVAGALVTSAGCQTRRDFRAAEVTEAGSRLDVVEEEAPLYRAGSRVRLAWRAGPGAPALQVAVARDGGIRFPPIELLRLGVRREQPAEVVFVLSDERPPLEVPFAHADQVGVLTRWAQAHRAVFDRWYEQVSEAGGPWADLFDEAFDALEEGQG